MGVSAAELELAQWRRQTAEMYAAVRHRSRTDPVLAREEFRAARDEMFRSHPLSPLEPEARASFSGLQYFPYDPAWRFQVPVTPIEGPEEEVEVVLPEGTLRYRRFATAVLPLPGAVLSLYWLQGYGGGLFLPFKDLTSGGATYGGGRYLYDAIKGADLGAGPDAVTLDFNFAYNPSCAYSPQWICPLAPRENALPVAVEAGERAF
jgi:uncharacterized protein (DUF1684 family)